MFRKMVLPSVICVLGLSTTILGFRLYDTKVDRDNAWRLYDVKVREIDEDNARVRDLERKLMYAESDLAFERGVSERLRESQSAVKPVMTTIKKPD